MITFTRARTLRRKILFSYLLVIILMGAAVSLLGVSIIREHVFKRAQAQVKRDLQSVRTVYQDEIERMRMLLGTIDPADDLSVLREKWNLDYLYAVDPVSREQTSSEIVSAAFLGNDVGATRLIGPQELQHIGIDPQRKAPIRIRKTPKAAPTQREVVENVMAIEYARPIFDGQGAVSRVIYGGKILNRNADLIDAMRSLVFEDRFYGDKPVGTVTIFQDDVRVSTNVLDINNERAVGTRVSRVVYEKVVTQGLSWVDRAFVVTDWYLTAYEPIYDINGGRIGILYVGVLERPFWDNARHVFMVFLQIVLGITVLAVVIAMILARTLTQPLHHLTRAVEAYSSGNVDSKAPIDTGIKEFNMVGLAFNDMAKTLTQRENSLKEVNQRLVDLNNTYLDLVGFVSHELKGILATAIMSAYSLKNGFMGELNDRQQKSVGRMTAALDYLSGVVRNFLNLSRIEKGEMELNRTPIDVKEDLVVPSIETFEKSAAEKKVTIEQAVEEGLKSDGDKDLLVMALNNLIGNAVKYSSEGKTVSLTVRSAGEDIEFEVTNDGRPIRPEEQERLFKKFSRLKAPENKRTQGTGLGLFITSEILARHGGEVRHEARDQGNAFIIRLPKQQQRRNQGGYHGKKDIDH